MARMYFGTDGIRGKAGEPPMTPEFFHRLGQAACLSFGTKAPFCISRDTRASGPMLEAAFVQGFRNEGGTPISLGVLPTAAVATEVLRRQASGGAMLSASHNPPQDNGIKFFDATGRKLTDSGEEQLEARLPDFAPTGNVDSALPETSGGWHAHPEAKTSFFQTLRATLPDDCSFESFECVVDAANGAAWETTPEFLESLGARVHRMNCQPDGTNINADSGSQHPQKAAEKVREIAGSKTGKQVIGLCHDGDADRLVVIDEQGSILDGDELLALLGAAGIKDGSLPGGKVVATRMSNLGLDECLRARGGTVIRSAVGDRYVSEAMKEHGAALGGEQSGHMIFRHLMPTGDGLLTALQLLNYCRQQDQPLSTLKRILHKYPQKLINLPVPEKRPLEELPAFSAALRHAEVELGTEGRVFFRYSGTEKKARLLIESRDLGILNPLAAELTGILQSELAAHK